MAENKNIQLSNTRLDALILPPNFSRAYQMYVLQQGSDMQALAGKANEAGQDASDAKDQNAEQDKKIAGQGEMLEKITGDYVSKTDDKPQAVKSSLGAAAFTVGGNQVVGARVTGITAATGAALKGAFDADKSFDADSAPDGLKEARQRIKALEDAMRSHGLIA